MQKYDVVIIGAGVAGLTAGKQLLGNGVTNFIILEAQDYVGGRIRTFHDWGRPIELGAEFIHGANTVTARLAGELGLATVSAYQDKKLIDASGEALAGERKQAYLDLLHYTISHGRHGVSIAEIIDRNPITDDLAIRQLVHLYYTDLEAGDSDKLDSGALKDTEAATQFNGANLMLSDGYQQVVRHLAADLPIRLDCPVETIDYTDPAAVAILLAGGETILADKVIITVSLGVLQHGSISFAPALPVDKQAVIKKLGMGQSMKFIVRLKDPHNITDLFRYADGANGSLQTITTWWANAADPHVLVGYCGGSRALVISAMDPERLAEKVIADLGTILKRDLRDELVDYMVVRWDKNPYTFGSYSNHPVGTDDTDREALARPIGGRLFWAGEATVSDGNYATVHGAISSGYRVADQVLSN